MSNQSSKTKLNSNFMPNSNRFRLSARQWLVVAALMSGFVLLAPSLWKRYESFDQAADYRLPYALSNDYWQYERYLEIALSDATVVPVVGDSVVWGEYVRRDGTLSHFLTEAADPPHSFVNAGINGMFPLALEGLANCYGSPMRGRKVVVHCNLLWMTGPEADMSSPKQQTFNHVDLVPQFTYEIPCYRAKRADRIGIVVRRNVAILGWVRHLQSCYFDQKSIPAWTLADDGAYPANYPNVYSNPLRQLTMRVPGEPERDRERGPSAQRHRAWFERGLTPQSFPWVDPEKSLQWAAFQRLVSQLLDRDNDVLVLLGPLNAHMIDDQSLPGFLWWERTVAQWCRRRRMPCVRPVVLERGLYGDASHPLTGGYRTMAREIVGHEVFRAWLRNSGRPPVQDSRPSGGA